MHMCVKTKHLVVHHRPPRLVCATVSITIACQNLLQVLARRLGERSSAVEPDVRWVQLQKVPAWLRAVERPSVIGAQNSLLLSYASCACSLTFMRIARRLSSRLIRAISASRASSARSSLIFFSLASRACILAFISSLRRSSAAMLAATFLSLLLRSFLRAFAPASRLAASSSFNSSKPLLSRPLPNLFFRCAATRLPRAASSFFPCALIFY